MQGQQLVPTIANLRRPPRSLPPNAMLEQAEATHEQVFFPMGEPLLFRTNDPLLLASAEDAFGRFPPLLAGSQQSPLVVELLVQDLATDSGSWAADGSQRPIYRTRGHLFFVSSGRENTAVADLEQGYAFGFLSRHMVLDRASVQFIFVEGLSLALLATTRNFIGVHAACVVKNGVSFILMGQSGAGKSTLAYACVCRGYQLLAEDSLMVKCRAAGAELWGMPWRLHLLPDVPRFFPELASEQPKLQVNGEWKLEVNPEAYHPDSVAPHARPGPVVFIERSGRSTRTELAPLPRQDALEAFEIVWPWWVGWTDIMEQQVPQLIDQGAYRLRMTGSPDEAVDCLDILLAQVGASRASPG